MSRLLLVLALTLAACNPSRPLPGEPDGGSTDLPVDGPDDPPLPPGTAMETVTGAGRATSASMSIEIQLGGLPGVTATPTLTVRPAPVLP